MEVSVTNIEEFVDHRMAAVTVIQEEVNMNIYVLILELVYRYWILV